MRRAAIVQLPAGRSVKITRAPIAATASRSVRTISSPPSPRLVRGTSTPPRPVIWSTAETTPVAKSPWPTTSARGARTSPVSLIVFSQILLDEGPLHARPAHVLDQPLVELLGRVDTAVPEQMVHRDHLRDDGDVLPGIERHGDLRDRDVEDRHGHPVQPRALDHRLLVPLLEVHDDLDPLLLSDRANAEDRAHVDQADPTDFHEMALELVPPAHEHVGAAPGGDHQIVGDEPVPALDEVEHALRLADAALAREEEAHPEDVRQRPV